MTAALTSRDVAARTVLTLMNARVLSRTPDSFRRTLSALGLTHGDLVRADQTMPQDWRPDGEAAPSPVTLARGAAGRKASGKRLCACDTCDAEIRRGQGRSRFCSDDCKDEQASIDAEFARTGRSGITRRCTRCDLTKPVEEFRVTPNGRGKSGQRRWKLKSFCIPCERGYQRGRYINTSVDAALNGIGLMFLAGEDETVLACADCGDPIKVGQRVVGETSLTHWGCIHPEEPTVSAAAIPAVTDSDPAAERDAAAGSLHRRQSPSPQAPATPSASEAAEGMSQNQDDRPVAAGRS